MTTIASSSDLSIEATQPQQTSILAEQQSIAPLRVVFAGTPEFAAVSLESLIKQQDALNIDIVAVYTQPDRKAGRGQKLSASAVKQVALANDIAIEQPLTFKKSSVEGMAARQTLRTYQPGRDDCRRLWADFAYWCTDYADARLPKYSCLIITTLARRSADSSCVIGGR